MLKILVSIFFIANFGRSNFMAYMSGIPFLLKDFGIFKGLLDLSFVCNSNIWTYAKYFTYFDLLFRNEVCSKTKEILFLSIFSD